MKKKNRTSRLTIRLTPEEYKHFLVVQRESKLTQADFLMKVIDEIPLPDKQILEKYNEINEKVQDLFEMNKKIQDLINLISEINPN